MGKPSQAGKFLKFRITSQENNQVMFTSSDVYLKGRFWRQASGRSMMTLIIEHSVSASGPVHGRPNK
ncbi:hypothetical protein XELAEV_18030015mg [Xenopus laevis]|uniref:Uncharacterized protein n=1 Tax=Xenopus laevis TaxID=8355 RepID=A0A974CUU7_XENLA|nr:hypothetical protein XELAEV_18030015mg [Xenopus laevis]